MSGADVKTKPWNEAVAGERERRQLETWKAALVEAHGSIERARTIAGIGYATATRLNKKFELGEFAAKLRIAAGGQRTGRPRSR